MLVAILDKEDNVRASSTRLASAYRPTYLYAIDNHPEANPAAWRTALRPHTPSARSSEMFPSLSARNPFSTSVQHQHYLAGLKRAARAVSSRAQTASDDRRRAERRYKMLLQSERERRR